MLWIEPKRAVNKVCMLRYLPYKPGVNGWCCSSYVVTFKMRFSIMSDKHRDEKNASRSRFLLNPLPHPPSESNLEPSLSNSRRLTASPEFDCHPASPPRCDALQISFILWLRLFIKNWWFMTVRGLTLVLSNTGCRGFLFLWCSKLILRSK